MHRYAAPADDTSRYRKVCGRDGEAAHRADTAAKLKEARQCRSRGMKLQSCDLRELSRQKRKHAVRVQQPNDNAEADDKAAYAEYRLRGLTYGFYQRTAAFARCCRGVAAAFTVHTEEQPRYGRGENVDYVQPDAEPRGAEHARSDRADEERGAGVAAKAHQAFRLLEAYQPLPPHVGDIGCSQRIAAHKPHEKRRRTCAGYTV